MYMYNQIMLFPKFIFIALIFSVVGVSKAHSFGYRGPRPFMPSQCYSSGTDLETLLQLAKFIGQNNKEVHHDNTHGINVDEIVSKLLNALIYTCTHNNGHAHNGYGKGGNSAGGGLVNVDLLKPGRNNVADVSLGGQDLVGIGVGGSRGKSNKKESDPPLIDVSLLKPGKNNIAEVDLAGEEIVGVGLGGKQED